MANLLAQHTLAQLVDIVEADLSDSGNAYLSAPEVQGCIRAAIYDMNRILPDQKIYELTLDFTVTDEHFTAALGVAVSLANKPIKYDSETVEETDDTGSFTRDTDYTMDYSNGTITALSTGSMTAKAYHISYVKSKLAIDLSALTDLIKVVLVEYPVGNVPQKFVDFSIWGDYLIVGARGPKDSQEQMGDTNHLAVYYECEHNIAIV